jgi:hypothetical protein
LFLTVSFVGTEGLISAAGSNAEGVVITQVVPPYDRTDLPTIKLYRDALEKYMSGTSPNSVSLAGFVDAIRVSIPFIQPSFEGGRSVVRDNWMPLKRRDSSTARNDENAVGAVTRIARLLPAEFSTLTTKDKS